MATAVVVPLDYGPRAAEGVGLRRPVRAHGAGADPDRARAHHGGLSSLLHTLDQAHPHGELYLLADNLSSHSSGPIRGWWLADYPRVQQAFIPSGAAWLNLIEGWWRLFGRKAFAGVSVANAANIAYVTRIATAQLNRLATPWFWGRPPPPPRTLRRRFVYRL